MAQDPTPSGFQRLEVRAGVIERNHEELRARLAVQDAQLIRQSNLLRRIQEQQERQDGELRENTKMTKRNADASAELLFVFNSLKGTLVTLEWLAKKLVFLVMPFTVLGGLGLAFWGSFKAWLAKVL